METLCLLLEIELLLLLLLLLVFSFPDVFGGISARGCERRPRCVLLLLLLLLLNLGSFKEFIKQQYQNQHVYFNLYTDRQLGHIYCLVVKGMTL